MFTKKEIDKVTALACQYFGNGYHCAEAVAAAVLEAIGEDSTCAVSHATAFGGGIGESFTEVCGVISGSMIVIGHLYGRKEQGDSWQEASELGRSLIRRFSAMHGTCNCGELRNRFGDAEQMSLCRKLVVRGTLDLTDVLNDFSQERDGESTSQPVKKC